MNAVKPNLQQGDLIAIDGSRGFNHGCQDYAILEYIGDGKGKVVEAGNCTSCWQVGHDQQHTFAVVGEEIDVDVELIAEVVEGSNWATSIKYELLDKRYFF